MALCISIVVPMRAATISDVKKEKEAAEQQLNNIKSNISNIEGDKEVVSEEITELDMQLVELLSTVEILQQDIENKEVEIAGIDATKCAFFTAKSSAKIGFKTYMIKDAIDSVYPEAVPRCEQELKSLGVQYI